MSPRTRNYEITFLVDGLTDDCIDSLYDDCDCLAGDDFEGREFITMTCPGPDAFSAAKTATTRLQCIGLTVLTTLPDLVTRSEIADRTKKSRQTVANWVNGKRGPNFPAAMASSGGGIWLWGEVHRWLTDNDKPVRDRDLSYPTWEEHERINAYLRMGARDVLGSTPRDREYAEQYAKTSFQYLAREMVSRG
ncbi:helix-turn-helix transcriptional regulator [Arsenicicoccus dermatophilus]|uniref:helix-turn-helix transcriptional regulator n=1 Tax=Arsenicicoccus dermatophilus TaxID=1076331 RepID=UPI003917663E